MAKDLDAEALAGGGERARDGLEPITSRAASPGRFECPPRRLVVSCFSANAGTVPGLSPGD
jgi:hypothetical protein